MNNRSIIMSLLLSSALVASAASDYSTVSGTVYDADDITGTTVFAGDILFNPRSQVFTNADGLVLVNSSRNVRLVDGYFSTTLYGGMYDLVLNGCTNEVTLSGGTDYDLGTLLVGVENGKVIVNSYGGGGSTNITDSGTDVGFAGGATFGGPIVAPSVMNVAGTHYIIHDENGWGIDTTPGAGYSLRVLSAINAGGSIVSGGNGSAFNKTAINGKATYTTGAALFSINPATGQAVSALKVVGTNGADFTVDAAGNLTATGQVHTLAAGSANTLVVTNGRVGIGRIPSNGTLDVLGTLYASGIIYEAADGPFSHYGRNKWWSSTDGTSYWTKNDGTTTLFAITNGSASVPTNLLVGGTIYGNGAGLTNITLTGPTNDAPVDTATVKAWVNFTNSTGGVFKYPLYQ
jgi:hypothetical protein